MADISVEKKQSGNMSWIWALVALAAVVGLMLWLFSTQSTTTQVVTEGGEVTDTVAEADTGPQAEAAELAAVGAAPDSYVGREIQVSDMEVAAVLGERGFWADVPGANPFLVILGPAVSDTEWLESGATVTVEGTVEPVTDTELDQWVEGETIRTAARDEASFATHYLQVSEVEM